MKTTEIERFPRYKTRNICGQDLEINKDIYLSVVLGETCNRSCNFCIARLTKSNVLSKEQIAKGIEWAIKELGVKEVLIVGGEPLLFRSMFYAAETARRLGARRVCVTTNGDMLVADPLIFEDMIHSGVTNLNISYMSPDPHKQFSAGRGIRPIPIRALRQFFGRPFLPVRLNANCYKGCNDTAEEILDYYYTVDCFGVDSVKFSPLLMPDQYSVNPSVTSWVKSNILTQEEYDVLFNNVIHAIKDDAFSVIDNEDTLGFVRYSMVTTTLSKLILNWNHRGRMMQEAEKGKLNNVKLLSNGWLSKSWSKLERKHVLTEF